VSALASNLSGRPGIVDGDTPAIDGIRMNPLAGEAGLTVAIMPQRNLGHRHASSLQRTSINRLRSDLRVRVYDASTKSRHEVQV